MVKKTTKKQTISGVFTQLKKAIKGTILRCKVEIRRKKVLIVHLNHGENAFIDPKSICFIVLGGCDKTLAQPIVCIWGGAISVT